MAQDHLHPGHLQDVLRAAKAISRVLADNVCLACTPSTFRVMAGCQCVSHMLVHAAGLGSQCSMAF